jgi:hypothetical protein
VGFWEVDEKPFGPVHEYEVADTVESDKVLPSHTGLFEDA